MKIRPLSYFLLSFILLTCSAHATTPPILVFGDSLSAAHGIDPDKGWATLLQQRLADEGYPQRVINSSVSGETTAGGVNRLSRLLANHKPGILILELGANDGLRGMPIKTMKDNLEKMIKMAQAAGAQVILVGMRLPPNYGPTYTHAFHQAYIDLGNTLNIALVPFLFAGLQDSEQHFQADALHPTESAQPILLNNIWPNVRTMLTPKMR